MLSDGLFVTGTDTEVGKTQVTMGLAAALQRRLAGGAARPQAEAESAAAEQATRLEQSGLAEQAKSARPAQPIGSSARPDLAQRAGAAAEHDPALAHVLLWKPVQTGTAIGDREADSYRLKMGSGLRQAEADIASVTLPQPLAPWVAARREGTGIDYGALLEEGRSRKKRCRFLMVEGAGGITVPFTAQERMSELALQLDLPLLIVARPGLGTVNHTLLTVYFARSMGLTIRGVILNGFRDAEDPALDENVMMIEHYGKVPVIGRLPWFPCTVNGPDDWPAWREGWRTVIERQVNLDALLTKEYIPELHEKREGNA